MIQTPPYQYLLLESRDGVARLTINRADKRNALSLEVMRELIAALDAIGADRSVDVGWCSAPTRLSGGGFVRGASARSER